MTRKNTLVAGVMALATVPALLASPAVRWQEGRLPGSLQA
jgi:hypothetical protein